MVLYHLLKTEGEDVGFGQKRNGLVIIFVSKLLKVREFIFSGDIIIDLNSEIFEVGAERMTCASPVSRSTSTSAAPTMNGGGEISELWVTTASSAVLLPHWEAAAICASVARCVPSSLVTASPAKTTARSSRPSSPAPT